MKHNSFALFMLALALSFAVPASATRPQANANPRDEDTIREIVDLERQAKDAALPRSCTERGNEEGAHYPVAADHRGQPSIRPCSRSYTRM